MKNKRLKRDLEEIDIDIKELEENIESLKSYKLRLVHNLSSNIDLDNTRVIDVLKDRFLLGKIKLVCKFHNFDIDKFTLTDMISMSTLEYLEVPWFGERSINVLQEWLGLNGLILLW